jgi:hypothetical protein
MQLPCRSSFRALTVAADSIPRYHLIDGGWFPGANGCRETFDGQLSKSVFSESLRGIENLDTNKLTLFIEIDRHPFGNVSAVDGRRGSKLDMESIDFRIVTDKHTSSPSEDVNHLEHVTRDYIPFALN